MAVFENTDIRFNYCYWGRKGVPFVFFTGFGEKAYSYKNLLPALPANVSLLVIETPIAFFKKDQISLENGLKDLLLRLGLEKAICLGGFSFGNWIASSLIQSKGLNIQAWVLVSPSTPFSYKAFQLLNYNKHLNALGRLIIGSKCLVKFVLFFLKSGAKRVFIEHLLKSENLLIRYLDSYAPIYSLREQFIHANSLKIPVLLLSSINDPISSSKKTIDMGNRYSENACIFYTNNKKHSAFEKEFLKEIASFLSRICI